MATTRLTIGDDVARVGLHRPEILCVRGRLQPDLRFIPTRPYSTTWVRRWPDPDGIHELQLLGGDGEVLSIGNLSARVPVDHEGAPPYLKVTGYVALRDGARHVRLLARGVEAWRAEVPPPAELSVKLGRVTKAGKVTLGIECSRGGAGAHVGVVLAWGPRRFRTVGIFKPSSSLTLDLASFPGGRRCQLVVHYSNGLRSASARTKRFALAERPPEVAIVRPAHGSKLSPHAPLDLEASVNDPQTGPVPDDAVRWFVDGEEAGRGRVVTIAPLSPGRHEICARYPKGKRSAEDVAGVSVSRPKRGGPVPGYRWQD